jgi:PAS domain S-box-containing protein
MIDEVAKAAATAHGPLLVPRVSWRRSLWLRLTIVTALALALVLGVFVWITSRVLTQTAAQTGGERALTAASQVAAQLGQNVTRGMVEIQRTVSDGLLADYILHPSPALEERIRQRMRIQPGQAPTALISNDGQTLLELRAAAPGEARAIPAPSGKPVHGGIGPIHAAGRDFYADIVIDIMSTADDGAETDHLGYLVIRRSMLGGGNGETVNRIVGTGAVAAMGNRAGDPWTNFRDTIARPPFEAGTRGTHFYRAADGTERIAGVAPVAATPWAIWIDMPRSLVLAPAQSIVRRMGLLALAGLLISSVAVAFVLARAMKPLNDLTTASEAIAAGDYERRIVSTRRDEVGRLGAAFNAMTDRVAQTHQDLEARVRRRTTSLEETRALLETQVTELTRARAELDRFFALSPDMLRVTTLDGTVLRMNEAWHEVLGWDMETLLAEPRSTFVHPDDLPATEAARAVLRQTGEMPSFENRYRARDGEYRWLEWRAIVIPDTDLVLSAARDVTEQKRSGAELERRAAELAALNTELETFSYSVSHDLRAPLRHVQGFAALLLKSSSERLTDTDKRWLETIDAAATRMGRLIDDLLALSRTGRAELRKVPVALDTIVRDARTELSADPHFTRAVWTIDPLPTVVADASLLRLVFVNLLSNALKYTRRRADPVINITTVPGRDGEAVVAVRDNGVGFDMKYADKLFGVFQRLHADAEFEGTGIGLANVRRIVQRHGGRVWAEGAVNEGATFYVALPSS